MSGLQPFRSVKAPPQTVIVGAGNLAENNIRVFNLINDLVYIHDNPRVEGEIRLGVPVEKRQVDPKYQYSVQINDPRAKRLAASEINTVNWMNLIHPSSIWIYPYTRGIGISVQPSVVVHNGANIGNFVNLLGGCEIGHDSIIGKYSSICPRAVISGHDVIGDGVLIGANATIREGLKIGEGAYIGQGSNVLEDVKENTVVIGNPARFYNRLDPW